MPQNADKLVFWGVRGSTPTLDRSTWRFGGNTPCLDLVTSGGTRIILDCGTGLRMLGNSLTESMADQPIEAHVLVTHYHWDHIQGIPFFSPFFSPRNCFHFYSFQSKFLGRDSLRKVLEAQLASPYFPVDLSVMSATRHFREISGGAQFEVGDTRITTRWLNHPQGCLGYRLDTPTGTIVYATDNEPGVPEMDESLRELTAGADVFINDAQYSPEQLASNRKGWGHSSWLEGVKIARETGARNLILFHHDPDSSDRVVDGFLQAARKEFPATWAATEGMVLTLGENKVEIGLRESRVGQRRPVNFAATVRGVTDDGSSFEEKTVLRDLSLNGAYVFLSHKPRLQSEVRVLIETASGQNYRSVMSLRGTVVYRDAGPEKDQGGVGVVFIEEPDPGRPHD
jgi:ribonuclease Z